jgi:hypothetical protein
MIGTLTMITDWATILAFVFLMLAALIAPYLSSKRTEKKLGKSNGGDSLYDQIIQARVEAKENHAGQVEIKRMITIGFHDIHHRLSEQDVEIQQLKTEVQKAG